MQFPNTWDTEFSKIAQGLNICQNGLYQSQLNHQNKNKFRSLSIRRQQSRATNIDQIVKSYDNYSPISELINWAELKKKNTVVIKKYRQSVYFGEFVQNKRSGLGIMIYTNGRIYEGEWYDNFKHGKGYQKFTNGAIYSGSYVKGKPEGYGTYSWENGETYQGQWQDGVKNGSGIWRGPTGDSYIGQWKNGQANGYGVHTWVNGDRYQGQFKDCLKHGEGIEKFYNGDQYKGTYIMGKPQGYGEYYWSIGSFYKGNFKSGMRNGKGVWKRGMGNTDKYQGQYKQDKKQGYGVFIWQNGNVYKGNFSNDMRNGYGQMYWIDGKVYKGQWLNNQQVGGNEQSINEAQQFQFENIKNILDIQRYKNDQNQFKVSKVRQKYRNIQNKAEQLQSDFFKYSSPHFQQPSYHGMIETQRKFRAREMPYKKQQRIGSQRSTRSYVNNRSHAEQNNQFVRKYSVGSRCSTNGKIKQGKSQNKIMSSTFYLYKIHSKSPAMEQSFVKVRPRQVKTSGGLRQKNISQQIKYFTRNKINPEFI